MIGKSGGLFNQANEQWRKAKHFSLEGNDEKVKEACVEVVSLCQQALSVNPKEGDAYVLLANALMTTAHIWNVPSTQEIYEFLLSRAAAVIHLWYCLPHRGYPITKNKEIGDGLWKRILEEFMHEKALNENAARNLMQSYKDNLAAESMSPNSFMKIREKMLGSVKRQEPVQFELHQQLLEEALQPDTWKFLANIMQKTLQGELHEEHVATDHWSRVQAMGEELKDFSLIRRISLELIERWEQAYKSNDFRQALGWITWHIILANYENISIPELSAEVDRTIDKSKALFKVIAGITAKAVHLEDWDTLLLSVGICEWAKIPEMRDKLLQILYHKVDKAEVYGRLSNIESQPRMAIERFLILYLQRALMWSESQPSTGT